MAPRSSAILVALVGLGAAAGLAAFSDETVAGKGPSDTELTQIAGEISGFLGGKSESVHTRASTLAGLPQLVAAVATDEPTVRDMKKRGELALSVNPGETIEIGQTRSDGVSQVLLRLPEGMKVDAPLDKPGQTVMVDGSLLRVVEVVKVTPKPNPDVTSGAVAVSQELSLGGFVDRLDRLGTAARVELDAKPAIAGTRPAAEGATLRTAQTASPLGMVKVIAEVLPAQSTRNLAKLGGAAVLALAGLVGAAVLWRRGGAASASTGGVPSNVVGGMGVAEAPGSGPRMTPTDAARLGVARTEMSSSSVPPLGERTPAPRLSTAMRTPGLVGENAPRFGRYRLIKQLGAGGMAEVYLASISGEAGFEKRVALKIMHANLATQEKVVDLFLDEARIVSSLTHPNIVQISDLGKDGVDYFIAMEFVDGWDLDKLVRTVRARGEHVPLRVGLSVLRKICDGLHAAHTAVDPEGKPLELVHRDVKAENVLLSRSGSVKVGDFGIAKANQQVHKTQLGELKGTAAYMAPEHRTGQAVDKRADIYGVGAIAYEVLTGNEVNLDLAMLAHLGREGWPHLPPPSSVRPELPPELDAIVFKALAYDRDARYPTCEAFEEALEGIASLYGLSASDKVVAQWVDSVIAATPAASAGHGAA